MNLLKKLINFSFLVYLSAISAINSQTVSKIIITGNKRIETETIMSYLPVKVGDAVQEGVLDECLKTLFDTEYFENVEINFNNRFEMIVKVVENPILNKIAYEGNSKIKDEEFKKSINLKSREVLSSAKIQSAQQRILEIYRRTGKFGARVEPKIIRLSDNRVDLVFEIKEGATTFIRKINFVGNKHFKGSKLEKVLQSKVWHWYRFLVHDDLYDPDRFINDQQELQKFYNEHGFAQMRILSATAELSPDKTAYFLTFTIDEGMHCKFNETKINSEIKSINTEELNDCLKYSKNDEYSSKLIDQSITNITDKLGEKGYAFVNIDYSIEIDDSGMTNVVYNIQEGPRVYIEAIEIKGNDRTHDDVIRREIKIYEGDAYNSQKLKKADNDIKDLQFFKTSSIATEEGSDPDKTKIVVEVEEQKTGEISLGGGYSSLEGLFTTLNIKERNVAGTGNEVNAGLSLSKRNLGASAGFLNPSLFDKDLAGGFDVFCNREKYTSYKELNFGTVFNLYYNLSEMWWQNLSYAIKFERFSGTAGLNCQILRSQMKNAVISEIGQTLHFGKLDSRRNPTKGFDFSYGTGFAGIGGTERFIKHTFGAATYYPLFEESFVFKASASTGFIQKIGKKVIRVVDSYQLGYDSFRGFDFQGLGARDKKTADSLNGTRFWKASVELKFPIGLPDDWKISTYVFNDFGALWKPGQKDANTLDSKAMRLSAGAGILWDSPFGPLGVCYAIPYRKQSFDQSRRLQLQFKNTF